METQEAFNREYNNTQRRMMRALEDIAATMKRYEKQQQETIQKFTDLLPTIIKMMGFGPCEGCVAEPPKQNESSETDVVKEEIKILPF